MEWEYLCVTFQNDTPPGVAEKKDQWRAIWQDKTAMRLEQGALSDILNAIGGMGWELVSFGTPLGGNSAVFKRRKS